MIIDDLLFAKFRALVKTAPPIVKQLLLQNADLREREDFHPELNTVEHIRIVTFRAMLAEMFETYTTPNMELAFSTNSGQEFVSGDISLTLASLLHDIGKKACVRVNPKTGKPTSPGHDKFAAELVRENIAVQGWIMDWGGDVETVAWLCENHMRAKPRVLNEMRELKKIALIANTNWPKMKLFTLMDDMLTKSVI